MNVNTQQKRTQNGIKPLVLNTLHKMSTCLSILLPNDSLKFHEVTKTRIKIIKLLQGDRSLHVFCRLNLTFDVC